MTYTMDELVRLLKKEFNPVVLRANQPSLAVLRKNYPIVKEMVIAGKNYLREMLLHDEHERPDSLVPLFQRDITSALNLIGTFVAETAELKKGPIRIKITNCYLRLIYHLKKLLEYIFINFSAHYNIHHAIPHYVKAQHNDKIAAFKIRMEGWLSESLIDEALVEQINEPFNKYLSASHEVTHYQLAYLRAYMKSIDRVIGEELFTNEAMVILLIRLRVNSDACVDVCMKNIEATAAKITSNEQRLAFLRRIINVTQRSRIEALKNCDHRLPEIEYRITGYLKLEIEELVSVTGDSLTVSASLVAIEPGNKILTSLPVQELAFLLRMMVDARYILNENYLEVLRVITKAFRLKKSKEISFESLRTKSYTIDRATIPKLQDKLMTLFNMARDY